MLIVKLYKVTLNDLVWTLILCGFSFLSDFTEQLIGIFVISFIARFMSNYLFFSREQALSGEVK